MIFPERKGGVIVAGRGGGAPVPKKKGLIQA